MVSVNTITSQIDPNVLNAIDGIAWPTTLNLLVAAPHPDDFDAIAVTLKHFQLLGCKLHLCVLSGGAKGVEDSFSGSNDWKIKGDIREQEQIGSCRLFGLGEDQITFLRLPEATDGELDDNQDNQSTLHALLAKYQPDMVFLPFGEDFNTAHQRTYAMVRSYALTAQHSVVALYNNDAKTTDFKAQLYTGFNASTAEWKGRLLRVHQSQQVRNLNQRGHGFDDRVLNFNRGNADRLNLVNFEYVEAFQYELFRESTPD